MAASEYEIRLVRPEGDITPNGLRFSELGDLLIQFQTLIAGDTPEAFLSLVEIRNKCVALGMDSNVALEHQLKEVADYEFTSAKGKLSNKRKAARDRIDTILGQKLLQAEFFKGDTKLGIITPKQYNQKKDTIIKCTSTLYGELVRIGGKPPKASIEHRDGYTIACDVPDKDLARSLASRLYTKIRVKGRGSRLLPTGRFMNFTIESLLPYEQTSISNAFDILRKEFGSVYSSLHPDEFVTNLRAD